MTWLAADDDAPESAMELVGVKILIPLAGLIDKDAELQRLDKEMVKRSNIRFSQKRSQIIQTQLYRTCA